MKRITQILFVLMVMLMVIGCSSQPDPVEDDPWTQPDPGPSTPVEPAPPPPPPPVAQSPLVNGLILNGASNYTVISGDTLSAIARSSYNNGFLFPLIDMANDVVVDYDLIYPDDVLIIPNLEANRNDARARANFMNYLRQIATEEVRRNRPDTADGLRALADSLDY